MNVLRELDAVDIAAGLFCGWLLGELLKDFSPRFRHRVFLVRWWIEAKVHALRAGKRDVYCPTCKMIFRRRIGWLGRHVSRCRGPGRKGAAQW